MRIGILITTALLAVTGSTVTTVPAAAAPGPAAARLDASPSASVHPSHGLSAASKVTVTATGLPPNLTVNIVQCSRASADAGHSVYGCPPVRVVTTSATGTVSAQFNPLATVWLHNLETSEVPVYCRADVCRYYIEWIETDTWTEHSVPTNLMYFNGDPATIAAVGSVANLTDGQTVQVSGSARRSAGRYVTIVQASCFVNDLIGGCVGRLPVGSAPLRADGTFSATVPVHRILADGTDCVTAAWGCQLHVVVLGADGEPDDSFGVSRLGDPNVAISFAP